MSSSFLLGFAQAVVDALREGRQAEFRVGAEPRVVAYVARRLEEAREGSSLISSLEKALLECPDVEELYVDLEELKDLVDGLR